MKYQNTGPVALAVLKECVIESGETGEISANATKNPGVASWIADGRLVAVKAKQKKTAEPEAAAETPNTEKGA